jgi:hypothetical protein
VNLAAKYFGSKIFWQQNILAAKWLAATVWHQNE